MKLNAIPMRLHCYDGVRTQTARLYCYDGVRTQTARLYCELIADKYIYINGAAGSLS